MKIEINSLCGTVTDLTRAASTYKKEPGSIDNAARAAVYYAKKNGCNIVAVPGNSYGSFLYHMAKETDDLLKYTGGMRVEVAVLVAQPNGTIHNATATQPK